MKRGFSTDSALTGEPAHIWSTSNFRQSGLLVAVYLTNSGANFFPILRIAYVGPASARLS